MKYIGRNADGTWNDDDAAVANASIIIAETQLEIMETLRVNGLHFSDGLLQAEVNTRVLIEQLKRVNKRKGEEPDMEDMDTWLDNAGAH